MSNVFSRPYSLLITVALILQCCIRLSVCRLYGMYILAKRCVLQQKLLLTAYMKSRIWEIDW